MSEYFTRVLLQAAALAMAYITISFSIGEWVYQSDPKHQHRGDCWSLGFGVSFLAVLSFCAVFCFVRVHNA
jgi:hypothetical protein